MRAPLDYYKTPRWVVDELFEKVVDVNKINSILDPAAGSGALIEGIEGARIVATDIDDRHSSSLLKITPDVYIGDFLESSTRVLGTFDIVLANPPYYLAEEFVKHSMGHNSDSVQAFADDGYFLLRLNFLASKKRREWLRAYKPNVYVLSKRPSYTEDGRTDGTEYGWFHFKSKNRPNQGRWEIL